MPVPCSSGRLARLCQVPDYGLLHAAGGAVDTCRKWLQQIPLLHHTLLPRCCRQLGEPSCQLSAGDASPGAVSTAPTPTAAQVGSTHLISLCAALLAIAFGVHCIEKLGSA